MNDLLTEIIQKKASDLHLIAGSPPMARVNQQLLPLGKDLLTPTQTQTLIYSILSDKQKQTFEDKLELDLSSELPGIARFRINVHLQRGSVAAAFRVITSTIPSLTSLGLPAEIADLARLPRGLVLVTGPTGSGKSTTLAAMIDIINHERKCHIITIEDPIEYVYANKKSMIEQRELGFDTHSFATALKHTLRQDPDVILVGELRDLETIATAITAAETGHLVFSTLHTNDSVQAVDRMVDVFPPHQQAQIRMQLSMTLQGVIAQQLLPRADGNGLTVAVEILRATSGIRNIIRKATTHELYSMLEIGAKHGMRSMDTALKELAEKGLINYEVARAHAINMELFK